MIKTMENLFQEWWLLTQNTYELIWPILPFAFAFGIIRVIYKRRLKR